MTSADALARSAIRDIMARYHIAGDRLRADDFAMLFAEDGILESDGRGLGEAFRHEGRDAVRAWMEAWIQPSDRGRGRRASFIRHHLTTSQIDILGEGAAAARSYFSAHSDIGLDHIGVYVDRFRRIEDRWLIAHRRVRLDWRAPDGLFERGGES